MDANTVQKQHQQAMENEVMVDTLITFFHRNIIRGLLSPGKRSATDVYRLLQAVKDSPSKADDFLKVLDGTHEVKPIDHVIDLGSLCKLPFDGAERMNPPKSGIVKLERKGDTLYIDGKSINLFLSKKQKDGWSIGGNDLRRMLEARGGNISAKVLDYLVAHPELWPESWKRVAGSTIYVLFWGDIFRKSTNGSLCVRHGYWDNGKVISDSFWLDGGCYRDNPAASTTS